MKRMTSEIIEALQKCVAEHGDLPFAIVDNDNAIHYCDGLSVFVNAVENGDCSDENESATMGISF